MTRAPASLWHLCSRNWSIKLLSLLLAFCIWSFLSLSREMRHDLVLPVELRNIPSGYLVTEPHPDRVHITITGPSILIDGARRDNSRLILSLRDARPGTTLFSHLETALKLPEGIKVSRISPATVEIGVTRKSSTSDQGDTKP